MIDPFQRFLGVEDTADAMTLLGLTPDQLTPVQIETALRNRLAAVYSHPDGRSDEAEMVRQALRQAADEIKSFANRARVEVSSSRSEQSRRTAAPTETMFNLTAFDRLVLAVLVGYGGWNAQSRGRLVALAASYGVSVNGLLRVLQGLGEYARQGGPNLSFSDIKPARPLAHLTGVADSAGTPVGPAFLDIAAENFGEKMRAQGPWMTVKLAIAFGIATVIVGIVALRIVLAGSDRQVDELKVAAQTSPAAAERSAATRPAPRKKPTGPRIAQFPKEPDFLGNGMPAEAVTAVDEMITLAPQLDEITRKLIVAEDPSEAVYRNWDTSIGTVATGWSLSDASTRKEVEGAMFEALRAAADTPSVSDRLLQPFIPPSSVSEPIDLVRGAWRAGMLGDMSSSEILPPVIVERSRRQASVALGVQAPNELDFESAARLWLGAQLPQMVASMEFDDRTYDAWELWLAVQRVLGANEAHDAALIHAMELVLRTDTDLTRPGPTVNVLGRLLRQALGRSNRFVKSKMIALFDVEQITARDLWVLTSLLASSDISTWFPDSLVLQDDADQAHRQRVRDDLTRQWPIDDAAEHVEQPVAAGVLAVNEELGGRWVAIVDATLREQIGTTAEDQVWQLVRMNRLLETALALEAGNETEAEYLLTELATTEQRPASSTSPTSPPGQPRVQPNQPQTDPDEDIEKIKPPDPGQPTSRSPDRRAPIPPPPPATKPSAPRIGQAIGRDGEWTQVYKQAGRNADARVDLIRQLATVAGTDLGPIDAKTLVEELYHGTPPEIRVAAQQVVVDQFAMGPTVAMELLNQFAGVTANDGLSQMIQDLSGQSLPGIRESVWPAQARMALVLHALSLRTNVGSEIDFMLELLMDSLVRQFMLIQQEQVASIAPSSVQECAGQLARAWFNRASTLVVEEDASGDLHTLQRRNAMRMKLADGPIQVYLAHQIHIMDLLAYIAVGERQEGREAVRELLRRSLERRARQAGSLEQAVEAHRAMLSLWKIRIDLPPAAQTQPGQGQAP